MAWWGRKRGRPRGRRPSRNHYGRRELVARTLVVVAVVVGILATAELVYLAVLAFF